MKLNPDCMRHILLEIEDTPFQQQISLNHLHSALSKYSQDEIDYALIKLHEAGFINARIDTYLSGAYNITIYDISYNGHQFLDNIRSNKVWNTTKKVASDIGSTSVQAITQIATGVISEIIRQAIIPS